VAQAFTPDRKSFLSVDALEDQKTQIKVRSLKIWNFKDGNWDLIQFVHLYEYGSVVASAINDTSFAVSIGAVTQIWQKDATENIWIKSYQFGF